MKNVVTFESVSSFSVSISRLIITANSPYRNIDSHVHDGCEIYVNLTGNVSFMVEKNIYSIKPGDIVITRPYEYHHCIYNSTDDHEHYWITFPVGQNKSLLSAFFDRESGQGNLVRLPDDRRELFLLLCEELVQSEQGTITPFAVFMEMLRFIEDGTRRYIVHDGKEHIPARLNDILGYMNEEYASIGNVTDIAERFHISVSTMEKYFKTYLDVTPKKYLEGIRLSHACRMLHQKASVTQVCFDCGFSDYSHFISLFKRNFHRTPLQYQKNKLY